MTKKPVAFEKTSKKAGGVDKYFLDATYQYCFPNVSHKNKKSLQILD
jgi:hypothetical protein